MSRHISQKVWRNTFFLGISILLVVATLVLSRPIFLNDPTPVYPIQGTFIQLLENSHGQWDENKWLTFFRYLEELKISNLYLQWTVVDSLAFFPSNSLQSAKVPPLETILKLGEQFDIKISIGLIYDPEYWNQITKNSHQVKTYLGKLLSRSKLVAQQIAPIAIKYQSFNGWYITEEVDDINWRSIKKKKLLLSYLGQLSSALEKLTPGYQIAISGFCNGHFEKVKFNELWDQLFEQTSINFALLQDGIGTNKLTFSQLPEYLEALKQSAIEHQKQVGVIIEIFRQTHGYPIDKKPFQAVPANLDRIIQQQKLASKFSHNLIAFSIPEYMMPIAGEYEKNLYYNYLDNIKDKFGPASEL